MGGGCHGLPTDLTEVQFVVLLLLCHKLQNVVGLAKQLNKLYNCITVFGTAEMCTEFWWGNPRGRDHLGEPGVAVLLCSVLQGSGGSAVFYVAGQWRFCCSMSQGSGCSAVFCVAGQWRFCRVLCRRAVAVLLCSMSQGSGGSAVFCVAGQWRFCRVLCCRAVAVLLHCMQYSRFNVTLICGVVP